MITACLITHDKQRRKNFGRILKTILDVPEIDEIIIEDNGKGDNIINYARYKAALRAKNDFIYTQDDDAVIHGLERIVEARNSEVLAYGAQEGMKKEIYEGRHMAILGWGAIFNREWIKVFKKYTDVYGEDYCFHRETDRIFTMLLGGEHNEIKVEVEHLEGAKADHALSQQEDHVKYKELAIKRCLHLART